MSPYMGAGNVMYCTAQVHSLNLLSVTCPQLIKMLHLCLDSLQKVACLSRPAGGAADQSWELVSPVTLSLFVSEAPFLQFYRPSFNFSVGKKPRIQQVEIQTFRKIFLELNWKLKQPAQIVKTMWKYKASTKNENDYFVVSIAVIPW